MRRLSWYLLTNWEISSCSAWMNSVGRRQKMRLDLSLHSEGVSRKGLQVESLNSVDDSIEKSKAFAASSPGHSSTFANSSKIGAFNYATAAAFAARVAASGTRTLRPSRGTFFTLAGSKSFARLAAL